LLCSRAHRRDLRAKSKKHYLLHATKNTIVCFCFLPTLVNQTIAFVMMQEYEFLLAAIRQLVPLPETDTGFIVEAFKPKNLKKKEILLPAGEISMHMRFVAKGCLRSYYLDEKAQEHTLQFGIEGWWINDLISYLTQQPAKHFVQAIEPSTVLQIHRHMLEKLFVQVPLMERFFRLKIQGGYVALQERTVQAMSRPAEERYHAFRTKYREIEQRVPQYMVASYLGITPEFLSTLRARMVQ
jgi:CRP-like cAMP-binding protein